MKKYIPRATLVCILILLLSYAVLRLCQTSYAFADLINNTVSVAVRRLLAWVSHPLPFSVFELLILSLPLIVVILAVFTLRRGRDRVARIRSVFALVGVISMILTSYIYTLAVGYRTTPLADRIGIEDSAHISEEELYRTVTLVVDEINSLSGSVTFSDGETRMGYSVTELSERLVTAYDAMLSRYPIFTNYTSRVKPVHFSTVMSDLGISGIYSFFTGEANVNVEYPDYNLPFTAAHEMAHQRGVSRENEANFVAFLVCISSEDEYVRYSGYLGLYEYLASALYRVNPELYYDVLSGLDERARADMRASAAVYNKHKDSVLGKINDRLNDMYLKANGTDGVVSYGYVVRLAVGYYAEAEN
jgi:hypothetical protein